MIAEYVEAGKPYTCYLSVKKKNGSWVDSENITCTPSHGLGEPMITNSPAANWDGDQTITFTTQPQVSELSSDDDYRINFRYSLPSGEKKNYGIYTFWPGNNVSATIWKDAGDGSWNLTQYEIYVGTNDFSYRHYVNDLSKLSGLPQQITISEIN